MKQQGWEKRFDNQDFLVFARVLKGKSLGKLNDKLKAFIKEEIGKELEKYFCDNGHIFIPLGWVEKAIMRMKKRMKSEKYRSEHHKTEKEYKAGKCVGLKYAIGFLKEETINRLKVEQRRKAGIR